MNKILLFILVFVLVVHFFYKEKPQFTRQSKEQNTSMPLIQEENNETKPKNLDPESNISEHNTTLMLENTDEEDLDSILPSLNELLSKLRTKEKQKKPVFTGFNPYISEEELPVKALPQVHYFAVETLPQEPELTRKDFHFNRQDKRLSTRLFEANTSGKILWQHEQTWELWRKKGGSNIHTLVSDVFFVYQSDDETGYLSDELGISLQKNKNNAYFLSIITPKHYINKRIQDFKSINEYFIFKLNERNFIVAYLFNRNFTKWWQCELTSGGLKSTAIVSNNGFEIFSSDTNAYEMRLSEDATY